jgi:hypothetical protein
MATESILSSVRRPSPAANRAAAAVRDLEADRVIGIVGALTVVVATGLSWYSERVSIRVSGALEASSISVTLWHLRMVAAVAGFGISVYSLVAMFTLPDGGSAALVGNFLGVAVSTSLDVGPFVALLGGLILLTGGAAASRES